jgi:DNA-binding NarL/FixJ family response regulator
MEPIKIIIADDSDFVRDGMRIILDIDDDFEVIGCAADGKEAVELARRNKCDVILMDIQMPVMDGIEATDIIVKEDLGKVLILTTFDDDELVSSAIKNGAKGYLIKNHTPDKLKQMIKSIHEGVNVMDEKIFNKFVDAGIKPGSGFNPDKFTERELQIIEAVASGLSNREIAEMLFISEGTVKNYISTILEKEDLSHRTQLAVYYLTGRK